MKLHLACGVKYKNGWHNVDVNRNVKADQYLDLVNSAWPWIECADEIYAEHFLEHLEAPLGRLFLRRCHTALKEGGTLRIAVPDLFGQVQAYILDTWRKKPWVGEDALGQQLTNGCEFLNVGMRAWGHKHMYDGQCLIQYFEEAGFKNVRRQMPDQEYETRKDSDLIVVGTK